MYRIKRFDFVSGDIIKRAIEMDHLTFQFSDWITEEEANLIYLNKRDCLIWLMHDDEPVGLRDWLKEKGESYSALCADAVSAEGCRCLERLGFNPIHSFGEEGTLYRADKGNVMEQSAV